MVAAVVLEQAAICPMCGTAQWQWDEDPNAFVPMIHIDHGCMIKDRFADSMRNAPKQPGSSVRLVPRDMAERMSTRRVRRPKSAREIARAKQEARR